MTKIKGCRWTVVRIDNGITNPHTGVVQNFKTEDGARTYIARANRRLQRQPGYATAWHPFAVWDRETGEVRE
jgi:hypothetical protein